MLDGEETDSEVGTWSSLTLPRHEMATDEDATRSCSFVHLRVQYGVYHELNRGV